MHRWLGEAQLPEPKQEVQNGTRMASSTHFPLLWLHTFPLGQASPLQQLASVQLPSLQSWPEGQGVWGHCFGRQ